jgi:hypothetical protein
MDDTRALAASDVANTNDVLRVLDLSRYPEEAAATLKSETETARLQEEETKKKAEEAEQRRVSATAATARAFRRRCFQAASVACMFVLLLLLRRAGRLPLRLRRLLASLLLWLRGR